MNKSDLHSVLLFQIDRTSRAAKQYSQKEMDERGMGITVDQWVLLKIIEERGPSTQKELAIASLRDPASITRTLDLLEKRDLVIRMKVPENRRSYSISLTSTGKRFIKKHMAMVEQHRVNSTKGLTRSEIEIMMELLKKMQKNFV